MNLSDFSNESFDPKLWINQTTRQLNAENSKDSSVTSLVVKLQVYFHQLNTEFEAVSQNVIQNLPRVMKEAETLSEEAAILRDKMNAVKQEIAKVGKDSEDSMASLERIDQIKTELVKAKEALHESDNWTVLSTDIEVVLETGDIDSISSKLVSMQQSLNVLSNAADYENKKMQLEGLKNRLEALASPLMVQAFTSKSIDQSKKFVRIFQNINRLPQLLKYYTKCQKALLIKNWHSLIEVESEDNIIETLQNFYSALILNWGEQVRWCEAVLPQIPILNHLTELYIDLLMTLSTEFSKYIDNNLKQMSDPLIFLAQLKQCSQQFANNLKNLIESNKNQSQALELAKAVYSPYVNHISKYGAYQQAALHPHLTLIPKDDIMDSVQNLAQLNSKAFTILSEAKKLCVSLTEGTGYPGFFHSAEWFLNNHLDHYRLIIKEISEQREKHEEVNMFQMCLSILQNLGDFITHVRPMDQECCQHITELYSIFTKPETHPFSLYPKLLLDPEKQKEFNKIMCNLSEMSEPVVFKTILQAVEKVCRDAYNTTFQVIIAPITALLESVQSAPAWKAKSSGMSSDLPDYSFVPQEYITQIGQYLMNLPQLLEPFLQTENPDLTLALSLVGSEYVQLVDGSEETGFAEIFLGQIAESTCQAYSDQILGICRLSSLACKQLATDISYLGNVLEDLGFSLTSKLQDIVSLLKLSPSEYSSQCPGCSPQIVAAVRQMRNIISE